MLDDIRFRLRALFQRNTAEDDLDDELRFRLERAVEQHVARGFSLPEAHRRARLEFGQLDAVKGRLPAELGNPAARRPPTGRHACVAADSEAPGVVGGRRSLARHRHRSQHRALRAARRHALATAARRSTGAARGRLHQRRRRLPLAWQLVPRLPGPAPRRPDARRPGGLRPRVGSGQDRRSDLGGARRSRDGRLLPGARRAGGAGSRVAAGRRPSRFRPGRGDLVGPLVRSLRRRSSHPSSRATVAMRLPSPGPHQASRVPAFAEATPQIVSCPRSGCR